MTLWGMILAIVISGTLGFFLGAVRVFGQEKQKAYRELLPPILKFAYHRETEQDERNCNEALAKLWLYGSKKVAKKMDEAISRMHHPSTGDMTGAFQETIILMRRDIRKMLIFPYQGLKAQDVNHIYSVIVRKKLPPE